jgi:transposase
MRAYSMDLRERVLRDSDAGLMADAVAERYHVSGSWVRWLKQRRRETGEVAPRSQRYGPRRKLEPHVHTLAALIQEQPDRTLAELQEALGVPVSLPTICRAVQQLGLRVKKNCTAQRARPA